MARVSMYETTKDAQTGAETTERVFSLPLFVIRTLKYIPQSLLGFVMRRTDMFDGETFESNMSLRDGLGFVVNVCVDIAKAKTADKQGLVFRYEDANKRSELIID